MRSLSVVLSVFALAAFSVPAANAIPLISNGQFELTTNGTNKQLSSDILNVDKRSTLLGWNSSNGRDGGYNFVLDSGIITTNASVIKLKNYGASADYGNVFASDALYYPGVLSQSINGLTSGTSYVLRFDYALGQQSGFDGNNFDNFWKVGFGSDVQNSSALSIANGGFSGWQSASMRFTADSASQLLSFLAMGDAPGAPPFLLLDNVSMRAAVPEPSTLSLMLGGVGLAAFLARRRRKATA